MDANVQEIISAIAFFLLGAVLGFIAQAQKHAAEVREWQHIARKAQRLNTLKTTLEQERRNGEREYTTESDGLY